jgi:tetratricopeptide (TPR) repeat protein
MNLIAKYITLITFLVAGAACFSQADTSGLRERANENVRLFNTNLDSAYAELDELIEQAEAANDSLLELTLLERKCRYYYQKGQLDDLIQSAEKLEEKANQYSDLYAEAMSNVYASEAYSMNQLFDQALISLEKGYDILQRGNPDNRKIFIAKTNVLMSFANTYLDKGEPQKAVAKMQEVGKVYEVLKDVSDIVQFQYLHYSNIGHAYSFFNLDSAKYYALKSIDLKPAKFEDDKVMLANYSVLGKVYKEKGSFQTSISYYKKAIGISEKTGELLNLRDVYTNMVDVYEMAGKIDSSIMFDNKLKELEISTLQRKYSSLQLIVNKNISPDEKNGSGLWIFLAIGGASLFIILLIFYFIKKNFGKKQVNTPVDYNSLVDLVKNNDPGFLFTFEQAYPDFSNQLLEINPQLSKSEIEFCALLKLNLTTKEIAQYKFLEPRTVQNKKHRIRKRLNIPSTTDIYNWFGAL